MVDCGFLDYCLYWKVLEGIGVSGLERVSSVYVFIIYMYIFVVINGFPKELFHGTLVLHWEILYLLYCFRLLLRH